MRGTWTPKLDDKFRLTLPAKYRDELTEEVTVICEQEHCLSIYSRAVLDQMLEPVNQASSTWLDVREYQRWVNSRAEDASPDKQGRITLTPLQRTWAGLERDLVVIGSGNRLEVWNPDRWEEYSPTLDARFANFNGEIVPGRS